MECFKALGFMDQTPKSQMQFKSWSEFTNSIIADVKKIDPNTRSAMEWLGLLTLLPWIYHYLKVIWMDSAIYYKND